MKTIIAKLEAMDSHELRAFILHNGGRVSLMACRTLLRDATKLARRLGVARCEFPTHFYKPVYGVQKTTWVAVATRDEIKLDW